MTSPDGGHHGHDHGHDGGAGDDRYDQAYWDQRYGAADRLWSGQANASLVAAVGALAPGRALDVGCGEGGDAIWLASRGWQVVGTDVSAVALERAAAAAAAQPAEVRDRLTWVRLDMPEGPLEEQAFDLVSACFLHLPSSVRAATWRVLADAVRPGGHLVVIAHDPSDPHVASRLAELPDRFFGADDVLGAIRGGWEVDHAGPRQREGSEAVDLVVDVVRRCS